MQQEFVEKQGRRKTVDVLSYGQERSHDYVARLHDGIRNEQPLDLTCEPADALVHVGKIARDHQKGRHVERVNHLLGIRKLIADVNQMEYYHQDDEHTFKEIYLVNTSTHGFRIGVS